MLLNEDGSYAPGVTTAGLWRAARVAMLATLIAARIWRVERAYYVTMRASGQEDGHSYWVLRTLHAGDGNPGWGPRAVVRELARLASFWRVCGYRVDVPVTPPPPARGPDMGAPSDARTVECDVDASGFRRW